MRGRAPRHLAPRQAPKTTGSPGYAPTRPARPGAERPARAAVRAVLLRVDAGPPASRASGRAGAHAALARVGAAACPAARAAVVAVARLVDAEDAAAAGRRRAVTDAAEACGPGRAGMAARAAVAAIHHQVDAGAPADRARPRALRGASPLAANETWRAGGSARAAVRRVRREIRADPSARDALGRANAAAVLAQEPWRAGTSASPAVQRIGGCRHAPAPAGRCPRGASARGARPVLADIARGAAGAARPAVGSIDGRIGAESSARRLSGRTRARPGRADPIAAAGRLTAPAMSGVRREVTARATAGAEARRASGGAHAVAAEGRRTTAGRRAAPAVLRIARDVGAARAAAAAPCRAGARSVAAYLGRFAPATARAAVIDVAGEIDAGGRADREACAARRAAKSHVAVGRLARAGSPARSAVSRVRAEIGAGSPAGRLSEAQARSVGADVPPHGAVVPRGVGAREVERRRSAASPGETDGRHRPERDAARRRGRRRRTPHVRQGRGPRSLCTQTWRRSDRARDFGATRYPGDPWRIRPSCS
jgi:hypothetical protein